MSTFEFAITCIMMEKIMCQVNFASKLLQAKDMDITRAVDSLKNVYDTLSKMRNDYNTLKDEALVLATKWGVPKDFQKKRRRVTKRHFDELAMDHRFDSDEENFRVNIYVKVFDVICGELNRRFNGLYQICDVFNFLNPKKLVTLSNEELFKNSNNLINHYKEDISKEFSLQMVNLVSVLKNEISELKTIKELAELIIIKYNSVGSCFSDVVNVLLLYLTIPVTTSTSERSFSKLKIIKNYLRTTMTEERLCGLAILSIEADEASKLEVKEIIRSFADAKARRKEFVLI